MKKPTRFLTALKGLTHQLACWSLLMLHVTPVMGQTPEDELRGSVAPTSGGTAVGVGTTPSEGGSGNGGVTKIEGSNIDPKAKMLLSNIALFAAAFTAPAMVMYCRNMISTYIYAGASALYVANEVGLFTRFKTASDLEMAAYLGRGDEESQIDSLETASKETKKAAKAAKTRALISKITAAGYAAAAAMAIYESFRPDKGLCVAPKAVDSNGIRDDFQTEKFALEFSKDLHQQMSTMNDLDAYFTFSENQDYLAGGLSSITLEEYETIKDGLGGSLVTDFKKHIGQFIKLSSDFMFANAHAGDKKEGGLNWSGGTVKLGVLGLGVAGAFLVQSTAKDIIMSKYIKTPYGRAAGFGAFAAFSYGASTESGKASEKLEGRANEYQELANQLRTRVNQNISTNGTQGTLGSQSVQGIETKSVAGNDNNQICFTGGPATVSPDVACDCAKTQTCKQPEIPKIDNIGEFNGKSLMVDSLKSLGDVGQDLYNGRLKTGTTKGQTLTKNAARITRLRDSMLDKLNKERAKTGKKPVELDSVQKRFEDGLLNRVNKAFNGLSDSEQASLARFSPGLGQDISRDAEEEKKNVAESTTSENQKVAKGDVNTNAGAVGSDKTSDGGNWNFDFNEDEPTAEERAAIAEALAEEDENYVVEGDISEDRNKNIFNIITRRYLKSAYPVIFEEDN